ncbi:MAG: methyl-accepting chemotaxis protein, partial [Hydrogenovibrio sp.]
HVSTVVEWQDRTLTAQLMSEVRKIHDGILVGDLSCRVDLTKADADFYPIAEALNMTLDSIVRSIDMSTDVAIAMSVGDFQQTIDQPCPGYFGVVKEALTVSMENISDILSGVKEVSDLIDSDSQEVRRASQALSSSSQSQAASIEQTSASMEQMTSAVQSSSENAKEAAEQTRSAALKAEQGVKVMQSAIESMEAISQASERIGDIITLIDSIAFQTNLLALNAAVEAARAGEHGRGFAVVAGEVRNLAGKSADAAKEIRGLIEDTLQKVEQGSRYVNDSGQSLNEIHQSIHEVQTIIDDISKSSQEQTQGISQVNIAISDIDSQVQKNALMAENTSQTAMQLERLTQAMTQNAQTFQIKSRAHKSALGADANFVRIRMAHRQWRAKARAFIHGFDVGVDPQKAVDPKACELGQWIYGAGQHYAAFPSYQALEKNHQAMHAHIGKIIQLQSVGDSAAAEANLDELERLSRVVVEAINEMEGQLAEEESVGHSGERQLQSL